MHRIRSRLCVLKSIECESNYVMSKENRIFPQMRFCWSRFGTFTRTEGHINCCPTNTFPLQKSHSKFASCVPSGIRCIHVTNATFHTKDRDSCNTLSLSRKPNGINVAHVNRQFSTSVFVFSERKEFKDETNEDTNNQETGAKPDEEKLTQRQKLKRAVKEYGPVVIIFHICIALTSLGFFYMLVSMGVDVIGILRKLGVSEAILDSSVAAGASTFVIAYAVHKMFAVPRIGITLTCAPIIVRKLRKIGIFKPPKPVGKK